MKYRVGDKVKTIGTFGKGKYSVGTIVEIDNSNTPYKVHFDNSDLYLWFSEREFETVEQLPFPIGTKVICSYDDIELFTGIFQGQSETRGDCWAIERDDNFRGAAQKGWWNWDKSNGIEKNVTCDTNITSIKCDSLTADYSCYTYYGDGVSFYSPSHYNEINKDNKFMSIKNKIKMLMTGEPEKTLIKHGILTTDKELTTEGKQLFNEFIENKFKEEFLKGLYEVLKDEKLED